MIFRLIYVNMCRHIRILLCTIVFIRINRCLFVYGSAHKVQLLYMFPAVKSTALSVYLQQFQKNKYKVFLLVKRITVSQTFYTFPVWGTFLSNELINRTLFQTNGKNMILVSFQQSLHHHSRRL